MAEHLNDEALALLREIRDGVRALNDRLGRPPDPAPAEPSTAAVLVRAIANAFGDRAFTTRDLLLAAWEGREQAAADLCDALRAAVGAAHAKNGRKIGRALARIARGHPVDGLRVENLGDDHDGAIWRVSRVTRAP